MNDITSDTSHIIRVSLEQLRGRDIYRQEKAIHSTIEAYTARNNCLRHFMSLRINTLEEVSWPSGYDLGLAYRGSPVRPWPRHSILIV